MTNVKINHPKEQEQEQVVVKHILEVGQYYLDTSEHYDNEIYLVALQDEGYSLVDINSGYLYAGADGMGGDDADFVLLSEVEISYTR